MSDVSIDLGNDSRDIARASKVGGKKGTARERGRERERLLHST